MNNKKKILIWSSLLIFITVSGSVTYTNYPAIASKISDYRSFSKAHLQRKKIIVNGEVVTYAEGGKGPTLVFIHGFQGNKRFWLPYLQPFISSFHVILTDLPAHGGSSFRPSQSFDLKSLAFTFDEFIQAKGLDKFQLIGTSLGAGVAMKYSFLFPDKVTKLVLVNPIGIRPSDEKELFQIVESNKRLFFPNSLEGLDELYLYLMGHTLPYSPSIKKYIFNYLLQKRPIFTKVYQDLVSGEGVEMELSKINIPTLLLVGKHDRVSRAADFEIYAKSLPHCTAFLLNDGYHILKGSALDKAIDKMREFISQEDR
jgi:abhydrolase domain-containing protein 6